MTLRAMVNARRWQPWLILAFSILTGLIVFTGILPETRPLVTLVFYLTCPGLAVVRLFQLEDPLIEGVLMVALSLALDAVVAMILLYAGAWSYVTGLLILIGISMLCAVLSIGQASRTERLARIQAQHKSRTKEVPAAIKQLEIEEQPEGVTLPAAETQAAETSALAEGTATPAGDSDEGKHNGGAQIYLAGAASQPAEPGEEGPRRPKGSQKAIQDQQP